MTPNAYQREIKINTCNGHISGLLGEAILKYFLKEKLIERENKFFHITEKGWENLELIGIDINDLQLNSKHVDICTENEDGIFFEHIGSRLGDLIKNKLFELKWLIYQHEKPYLTQEGIEGLTSFGITIKKMM
jgi:DNA-binding PadR family transcriptional regulator